MTPEQAAHDLAPAVVRVPGAFMMDGATFTRGGELGFDGLDFYIAGRGARWATFPPTSLLPRSSSSRVTSSRPRGIGRPR